MGEASQYAKGIHGILMLTAWMLCASISIMVARFFRAMPGPRIMGVGIWFNIHRFMMVCTLLLTLAAFIYIVIEAGSWDYMTPPYKTAHSYIGAAVTFLLILNPILALVRPPPDGAKRVFFNWVHWGVGMSAWILAMINIAFGLFMLGLNVQHPAIWIYLAFIVEHGITDMMYTKFQIEDSKRMERSILYMAENDKNTSGTLSITEEPPAQPPRAVVIFRYAWMVFYCVDVLGYWIAIVVLISNFANL